MRYSVSRRNLFKLAPLGMLSPMAAQTSTVSETFPQQSPAMVREMVSVSHGNVKRVRELVEAHPSLAKAVWDWGFGDWESALGAASHVGNREIAEHLIAHGARPSLFSATMLGHLDVVKAFITAQPGVQKIPGPHSISLLAHAKAGGTAAEPVRAYLESLGDAGSPPTVPLTEEQVTALAGKYKFGTGPADWIDVTATKAQLSFTRPGTTGRPLVHLGDRVFHPAGASAVRIRFSGEGVKTVLTVLDPEVVLTGQRVS